MEVQPIERADLPEVGRFLNVHLNPRISPETWSRSLEHRWAAQPPNHGMQLLDGDRRVGVMCAVYSDQTIDGKPERFCNPHSWCVLDDYRHGSLKLVLALLGQRGYHFTMYTPNPKVAQVFLGMRFRLLDDRLLYLPNWPAPWAGRGRFAVDDPDAVGASLDGQPLRDFQAHRDIPWLRFVAFGRPGDACLAVYKASLFKRLGCANLLHLSDPGAIERHGAVLGRHLLGRGLPWTRVEGRFLAAAPRLAWHTHRTQPKLFLSRSLADGQASDLYSELVALDL